ncbi:MAG TPA: BatD family protein [Rhodanobacteraceae bacterium]|nr:BatD family protein [Rhodanobacteraceae bacterium]
MTRRWWIVLLVLMAPLAQAASVPATGGGVRAFLDRSHVSLGDTVTLNIQSNGPLGTPDLTPLEQDFQVLGTSNSSSVQIGNGKTVRTTQLGIALKPLHAGTLTIPALDVGGAQTQPLTLQVGAAPTGGSGRTGDPVFMETSVLSSSPYVGEQTVYTVRLFYLPGVDGSLGDPGADGASLVKLDRDHRYTVDRNGYAYQVIEYSWALIPQRTGTITVRGPTFQGQKLATGNPGTWFNDPNALLNNPNAFLNGQMPGIGAPVSATAPVIRIDARAAPAHAGKPWLPARDVQLKLTGLPANGEVTAGVPLTVTLSVSATGQPADALPEPELPAIAGARVYPDQTRDSTDDSDQWLQGTRTRNFAIVPQRDGKLTIPAITLDWWNVANDRAEQASVAARTLQVTGAIMAGASAPGPIASSTAPGVVRPASPAAPAAAAHPRNGGAPWFWRAIALASLALWLLMIIATATWWLVRRKPEPVAGGEAPGDAARAVAGTARAPSGSPRTLQAEALEAARSGDAAACEHALLAWARVFRPDIANVAALHGALSDPAQRDALDALQRVRWHGGDAASACSAVVTAFAHGLAWQEDEKPPRARHDTLPPLYPR